MNETPTPTVTVNVSDAPPGSGGGKEVLIDASSGSQSVIVEQGPVWLARFLFEPPWWAPIALYALLLAVLAGAAYKVARGGVEPDAGREAANRAVLVTFVVAATLLLKGSGLFPYAVDVAGGAVLGVGLARYVRGRPEWREVLDDLLGQRGEPDA